MYSTLKRIETLLKAWAEHAIPVELHSVYSPYRD
jgi:hypothetical protein